MKRALLLVLLVSACAASDRAPISYGNGAREQGEVVATPRPRPPAAAPNWAEGEGVPLSAYALRPEDAQPYDPSALPRTHRVGANESLYDIASAYQIPLQALAAQNNLRPPYAVAAGRVIELPRPRLHRVARGEDIEAISRRYNVDLHSLALLNRLRPPYALREGESVVLPAVVIAGPPAPSPATVARPSARSAGETPAVQAAPAGPPRFTWPMRGEILANYGLQPDGRRLDGIEIAAREGAQILAAAEGDVVYAGADLPAYGTLVLIRHGDGYVTAYGYARRALVREGQHVRGGEAIGEVGRIGERSARVLFQARRGAEATDPLPLLDAQ
jgi:murein DD-endopeptidase MepM/ murein hydrolase activator NlpD